MFGGKFRVNNRSKYCYKFAVGESVNHPVCELSNPQVN